MSRAALLNHPDRGTPGLAPGADELAPWFHNLHFPDGTQTAPHHPLGDFPAFKWREVAGCLPGDLTGWTALDIGCNAGFYSLELARRGANVTALDVEPHFLRQLKWALERVTVAGTIEIRPGQIYDLARESRRYDLILFLGVFYHLRYPLLGLDLAAERVGRILLFQTLTMPGEQEFSPPEDLDFAEREQLARPAWPKLAFIERKLAGDATNWWAPNHAAVEAMLRSSGLRVTARPAHEFYLCEPAAPAGAAAARAWDAAELRAAIGGTAMA